MHREMDDLVRRERAAARSLADSRAETSAARFDLEGVTRDEAAALRERDAAAAEVNDVYRALAAREERDAAAAVRAALSAPDVAEDKATGVYEVAAAALDRSRRVCDAVDVMSIHSHAWVASYSDDAEDGMPRADGGDGGDGESDDDGNGGSLHREKGAAIRADPRHASLSQPSLSRVERGVDEGWATARRLVGAAWARGRYELVRLRREALSLDDGLRRAELAAGDRAAEGEDLREAKSAATRERVAAAEARAAAAEAKVWRVIWGQGRGRFYK